MPEKEWEILGNPIISDTPDESASFQFYSGMACPDGLSMSSNGKSIAVGYPNENNNRGQTKVFDLDETHEWKQRGSPIV